MLVEYNDVAMLFEKKCNCMGTAGVMALSVGLQAISMLTQQGAPSAPPLPPIPQADKEADKNIANQIKQQKKRANTFGTKDTLLAGGNINDSELNLNSSLIGGR